MEAWEKACIFNPPLVLDIKSCSGCGDRGKEQLEGPQRRDISYDRSRDGDGRGPASLGDLARNRGGIADVFLHQISQQTNFRCGNRVDDVAELLHVALDRTNRLHNPDIR